MQYISILGSTGSIGTATLDVVRRHANMKIVALAAHSNISLLQQQVAEFSPRFVVVYQEQHASVLRKKVSCSVLSGVAGLIEAATHPDIQQVMFSMSGIMGLQPLVHAIESGKHICFANKEILVAAGPLVMSLVKKHDVRFLPVDSEHNALFQCVHGRTGKDIRKLILTASGGPFWRKSQKELLAVTLEQALQHPNWAMGKKITVDSSTMMNKGLEVIEAAYLFDMDPKNIEIVIHPQSIIHSMVEWIDGSIHAVLSNPDMRMCIQYALTYPQKKSSICSFFDFSKKHTLTFHPPDTQRFSCIQRAYDALTKGGLAPCFLNACNDVLVDRFCKKEIAWTQIAEKLRQLMSSHQYQNMVSLAAVMSCDHNARILAKNF
jgi:1-deoxy-D-xylulose-5-phosphate reductoisomerase